MLIGMWGMNFEDKLDCIDEVVYRIFTKEEQKPEEFTEETAIDKVEDTIIAEVTGYFGANRIFTTTDELVRVEYVACRQRNFYNHPDLKILRPKLYYTTTNTSQEDIDFRILANIMNAVDNLEKMNINVTIRHVFLNARTTLYETGQQTKQQVLKEAKNRRIELPVENTFYD